jgi:hypothetical protein
MSMVIDGTNGLTFNNATTQNSGGKVLQVVQAIYQTAVTTTSTSYVDTGLSLSITPLFSTSKIAVIICQTLSPTTAASNTYGSWRVLRGATEIYQDARTNMYMQFAHGDYSCYLLDSPATTSATTYKTQMLTGSGSYILEAQHANLRQSTIMLMEIAS